MKKVSVIIPCYNVEEYLSACLESLLRQTIGLDNLDAIAQQYPDSIRVFHLPQNCRQGGARNVGLEHAIGEYVAFLDADDWVDVSAYQKLYELAQQYDTDIIQYPIL